MTKSTRSAKSMYFTSAGLANLTDGVSAMAWGWLAVEFTNSLSQASMLIFIWKSPWLLLTLPIGVVVDRFHRVKTIVASDAIRAILFGLLTCLIIIWTTQTGGENISLFILLCGFAFVIGTLEVIRDTAAQAAIPTIFEDDALERSNSNLWLIELLSYLALGPLLAAILFEFAIFGPFLMNTALLFGAAYLSLRYVVIKSVTRAGTESFWTAITDGLRFFRSERLLPTLSLVTALWNIVFFGCLTTMVYLAKSRLNLSATEYGTMLALASLGPVTAALVGPALSRTFMKNHLACAALFVAGLALLALLFSNNFLLIVFLLATILFCGPIWNVVSVTYRQRNTPEHMLGRVIGVHRFAAFGASAIGPLVVGIASSTASYSGRADLDIALSLCVLGIICLSAGIIAFKLRDL